MKHIIGASGGGGFSMEPENPLLDDFILSLTGKPKPKVCFVPTASGDSAEYALKFYRAFPPHGRKPRICRCSSGQRKICGSLCWAQDVIYVGGGSTVNLLAVWRAHGLGKILREAWDNGVILCGVSAGAICWFESGSTDSFGPLAPLENGLGFLPGSFCPHYDGEALRRSTYHRFIADGLPDGYAADDGAALHFIGTDLAEAISSRPAALAYRVERQENGVSETPLATRFLG